MNTHIWQMNTACIHVTRSHFRFEVDGMIVLHVECVEHRVWLVHVECVE